jgi:hypothetical protein
VGMATRGSRWAIEDVMSWDPAVGLQTAPTIETRLTGDEEQKRRCFHVLSSLVFQRQGVR